MATRSVRFKFNFPMNPASQEIHFDHVVPQAVAEAPPSDPAKAVQIGRIFASTIKSVAEKHESACLARGGPKCITCGKTRCTFAPIPAEFCHDPDNSWIRIDVHPLCDSWQCLYEAEKGLINGLPKGDSQPSSSPQPLACKVCGITTGIKRCTKCKEVGYCGKDHQRKDWKLHKKTCFEKHDCDDCNAGTTCSPVLKTPGGKTAEEEEEEWVSTDEDSDKDDYDDYKENDVGTSFTYSGVFNLAAPGQPPKYAELTKDQVLAHLMSGRDPE